MQSQNSKYLRLKRQTHETYLHIITSHFVSVKIWFNFNNETNMRDAYAMP